MISIEEVNSIPILDVVRRMGIELQGTTMRCINPDHDDKSPSLSFNVRGNYFYCFGCGLGGQNINFVMVGFDCDFKEALHWLANQFGISKGSVQSRKFRLKKQPIPKAGRATQSEETSKSDHEIYKWLLDKAKLPNSIEKYLIGRGFLPETISHFELAGTIDARSLIRLAEREFGKSNLLQAGLLKEKKGVEPFPIWWGESLLVPFWGQNKEVLYLQSRQIHAESGCKYFGPARKKKPLFNFEILNDLPLGSVVLIVEGVMDVMAAYQIRKNAIGVLGATTGFKREWVIRLQDYQVIVIPDEDPPGQLFKNKVVAAFAEIGKTIEVIHLPPGFKDLGEMIDPLRKDT